MIELSPNELAALEALEWELSGPHDRDAIAEHLGISREWVRIIERRALEKLGRALQRAGLEGEARSFALHK